MSTPSVTSDIASSPAIQIIQTDFVGELLAGNEKVNIGVASAVAGLYFIFLLVAFAEFVRYRLGQYLLLVFFCAVRVVAFSVRAYIQKNLTTNLAIVYETFFAFGFVLLVKLLCLLLTAWNQPIGVPLKRGVTSLGLLRAQNTVQERVVSILLFCAQILVIVGSVDMYSGDATVREYNKGLQLLKAGYTIFLVCIAIYDVSVLIVPCLNRLNFGKPTSPRKAGLTLLSLEAMGLFLTTKAVFQVIAIYWKPSLTFNPRFFYPLEVAPEFLVLLLLVIPGYIRHVLRGSHGLGPTGMTPKEREAAQASAAAADPEVPSGTASPVSAQPTAAV